MSTIIDMRLKAINDIIKSKLLEGTIPLKYTDITADTECFSGGLEKRNLSDNKTADTKTILGKRSVNFYKVITDLNSKLVYIKSGAYGNTFKGIVYDDDDNEIYHYALKVVAFPKKEGYGSMNNLSRPENAEICMLKLLSYFVIKRQTPHIILPLSIFNTSIKPFVKLQEDDTVPLENENYAKFVKNYNDGYYYDQVSIVISEWANRGDLGMFLRKNYKKLELIHWQCLFFQIISTLAIIQNKFPNFRHNDLKANNILISKVENDNMKIYRVNKKKYAVPAIGYCIYIWDFDFACIPGVVENDKVYQEWTNKINITSEQNRYYDIHYFFSTLVYKGFLPDLLYDDEVPNEVKDFIHYVIPKEYRPGTKKVHKKCRLLVDDEYITPLELLDHDFFKKFAK